MASKIRDQEKLHDVKKVLGIPVHEPIFILRGQDKGAPSAIDHYADIAAAQGATDYFVNQAREVEAEFNAWQDANPDHVKVPDMDEPKDDNGE